MYPILSYEFEWSGGIDYNSTPINATFPAGVNSTTVNISIFMDNIVERPEMFDLSFTIPSSLSGRVIFGTKSKAVGNIIDDTSKIIFNNSPVLLCCYCSYYHKV